MKKRFTLIGLIASMLVLSACGNATEQYTEKQQALIDEACVASEYYIETLDEYATMPEIIEMYNAGDEDLPAEISGWIDTQQVIGILADSKVSEEIDFDGKSTVTVTTIVEGTNIGPDGNPRQAEVVFTYNQAEGDFSIISNVKYTFGELMKNAGLNTLLGMGTVFSVLILIMFVIMLFEIPSKMKKKSADAEQKTSSVDKAVEQIAANEEAQEDDTELIAVISAAIAAYEGSNASGDGYVVRSIRRIR